MYTTDPHPTDPARSTRLLPPAPPGDAAAPRPSRAWAWTGAAGGLLGLVGLMATGSLYDAATGVVADNSALAAAVAENATTVWIHQVVCGVVAVCMLVFALGLRRHLAAQEPAGSLVPGLAGAGVGLVAVALLVGGGIDTEMWWALAGDQPFDPDTIGAHVAVYNTISWLWAGVGVTAGAVAYGGFRNGSVGRALTWFSVPTALLVAATQVTPTQYAALMPAALWLIVAGLVLGRGAGRRA
ncbi:MAG TPA: hypothetical protein VD813_14285 [Pseudonocardia sp.]|nr:hypothetical protein [Pseudonocardia sp.]